MHEAGIGGAGDDARQGGFATARGTPEDHRKETIAVEHTPYQPFRADHVGLAYEIGQPTRAHTLRQRPRGLGGLTGVVFEKVHAHRDVAVAGLPSGNEGHKIDPAIMC